MEKRKNVLFISRLYHPFSPFSHHKTLPNYHYNLSLHQHLTQTNGIFFT